MSKPLNVLNNPEGACAPCSSTGCGTCGSTTTKVEAPLKLSRRQLGRIALVASAGALMSCSEAPPKETAKAAPEASPPAVPLSQDLNVVQKEKGPILTVVDEFYKMGPGPSSSHTIGPMRITYDFYQRISKLPEDQLKRATAVKVHLFGSLSATGKGHGTDRASLAGLLGKSPATCPPEFLDGLAANPDEVHKLMLGPTTLNLTGKDVIFDATKGNFPNPNTMSVELLAGDQKLFEQEYYSVGGGFIEWKGY